MTLALTRLSTATPEASLSDALAKWKGFVAFRGPRPPRRQRRLLALDPGPHPRWRWQPHWKRVPPAVDAIGCHFVADATLDGFGILTKDGALIEDGTPGSRIAARALIDRRNEGATRPVRSIDDEIILFVGPGHEIWGHWLIEFLPRIGIARDVLGESFAHMKLTLPRGTPDWAVAALGFFSGVPPDRMLHYDPDAEIIHARKACIPTWAFTGEYHFHPFMAEFYRRFRPSLLDPRTKLYVSRAKLGTAARSKFPDLGRRRELDHLASRHGFGIVHPEDLSLPEQIRLFASASAIVGEHGSGLHNAIFSEPGTVVGAVGMDNVIQLRIGELCRQTNVYMNVVDPADGPSQAGLTEMFRVVSTLAA